MSNKRTLVLGAACLATLLLGCAGESPYKNQQRPQTRSQTRPQRPPARPPNPAPTQTRTQPSGIIDLAEARHIAPATVNKSVREHTQDHTVLAADGTPRGLFLWLAGSGAQVDYYTEIMRTANELGYHVIGLSYANDPSLIQICGYQNDVGCFRDARLEKLDGKDRSSRIDIAAADSINARLSDLLGHLDSQYPSEGWGQYLSGGAPDWDDICVAGHSQGGGMAAMIAQVHRVDRAVMFSSPSDHDWRSGELAPWTRDSFATPTERMYGLSHEGERNHKQHIEHWSNMGLDKYGQPRQVDGSTPPYGNAHILKTDIAPVASNHHVAPIGDAELQRKSDGAPVMRETWAYLIADGGADRLPAYTGTGQVASIPTGRPTGGRPSSGGRQGGGNPAMEEQFKRMDRNGDGRVARSEIPKQMTQLHQAFDRLDRDGDGYIDSSEVGGAAGGSSGGRSGGRNRPGQPSSGGYSSPATNSANVADVSPSGESYIDPEFLSEENLMTFVHNRAAWLGYLDPKTGLCVNRGCKDILITEGMASLRETSSGPEFGIDRNGWSVIFDKPVNGTNQIWQGFLRNGKVESAPITSGSKHQTSRASKDPTAPSTRVAYLSGDWQGADITWIDLGDSVRKERFIGTVEPQVIALSWVRGSRDIVMAQRAPDNSRQLFWMGENETTPVQISNDGGDKSDPYAWRAPEFGNDYLIVVILDHARLGIYRDTGGKYWERIMTLEKPPESRQNVVGSAEPFVAGGKSYISLSVKDRRAQIGQFEDAEMWVWDIDDNPATRFTLRCDSGESPLARFDPETYFGTDEVFLYYNALIGKRSMEVRRCATGIRP